LKVEAGVVKMEVDAAHSATACDITDLCSALLNFVSDG